MCTLLILVAQTGQADGKLLATPGVSSVEGSTGGTMLQVHQGINEAKFNQVVDIMIDAMNAAGISIGARNRLLSLLAPMRSDIIYQ